MPSEKHSSMLTSRKVQAWVRASALVLKHLCAVVFNSHSISLGAKQLHMASRTSSTRPHPRGRQSDVRACAMRNASDTPNGKRNAPGVEASSLAMKHPHSLSHLSTSTSPHPLPTSLLAQTLPLPVSVSAPGAEDACRRVRLFVCLPAGLSRSRPLSVYLSIYLPSIYLPTFSHLFLATLSVDLSFSLVARLCA
eukprot:2900455-Pleurochrysis_carterae.AAC.3